MLPPKRLTSRFLHRTVAMWGVRLISSGEIIYEARNSLPPGKNSFPGSPGTARFQRARGFPIRGARKMRALSGSAPTPLLLCLENTGWGNQVQLVDTRFTNRSSSVMAGTAMPRSHRGTGVSPVTDWVVYGYSLSLAAPLLHHSPRTARPHFSCAWVCAAHVRLRAVEAGFGLK